MLRVPLVASTVDLATGWSSSSPWSWSPSPNEGSAPAPQPPPPRPSGRCRPRRSSSAAGADPRPPPGCPWPGTARRARPGPATRPRRRTTPPAPCARHRHPEHGPGDAAVGVADLGVVGEVAGEAHGCLGHGCIPPECLAGRSALPLEPGDGGHRGMPRDRQGQAVEPTKSTMGDLAGHGPARVPGWLVGCLRLGVGHASTVRPDPSTLGAAGERGSHHESRSRPVPGRS
jgi:hypothetical protein